MGLVNSALDHFLFEHLYRRTLVQLLCSVALFAALRAYAFCYRKNRGLERDLALAAIIPLLVMLGIFVLHGFASGRMLSTPAAMAGVLLFLPTAFLAVVVAAVAVAVASMWPQSARACSLLIFAMVALDLAIRSLGIEFFEVS
jgi:hypothetical protein